MWNLKELRDFDPALPRLPVCTTVSSLETIYSLLSHTHPLYHQFSRRTTKPIIDKMTSHAPGSCCYKGVKHEGQPVGSLSTVKDFEVYTSYPENKSTDYAVLMYVSFLSSERIPIFPTTIGAVV
jgi:hypothetical protein